MSHMKFSESLTINILPDVIERRIGKYLTRIGYQMVSEHNEQYVFTRGSMLGNFTSNNPRDLKTTVTIGVSRAGEHYQVAIAYDVNTLGQIVLDHERDYWEQEIEMLAFFVAEGKYKSAQLDATADNVLNTNHMIMVAVGIFTFVMVAGLMAFVFNI